MDQLPPSVRARIWHTEYKIDLWLRRNEMNGVWDFGGLWSLGQIKACQTTLAALPGTEKLTLRPVVQLGWDDGPDCSDGEELVALIAPHLVPLVRSVKEWDIAFEGCISYWRHLARSFRKEVRFGGKVFELCHTPASEIKGHPIGHAMLVRALKERVQSLLLKEQSGTEIL